MAVVPILAQRRDDGDHAEDRSGEELHLLNGVSVDHDGPANVSKYFLPSIQECHVDMRVGDAKDASAASTSRLQQAETPGWWTGSFRGRLLRGARVTCEDGYKIYVMEKESDTANGGADEGGDADDDGEEDAETKERDGTVYRIVDSRESFMYWKHHVPVDPSTDALYRAMQWVGVAGALHD